MSEAAELDIYKLYEELHEVKTFFGAELDNYINFSIDNPCEEMLKEKSMPEVEVDIDIKSSSIEKLCDGLKSEEEIIRKSIKEEEIFTFHINTVETKYLKRDCYTLNSSFHLYFDPSFQKY